MVWKSHPMADPAGVGSARDDCISAAHPLHGHLKRPAAIFRIGRSSTQSLGTTYMQPLSKVASLSAIQTETRCGRFHPSA